MIRALGRTLSTIAVSLIVAATVVVTAFLAAAAIVVSGIYLALWPPKQKSPAWTVFRALLDSIRKGEDGGAD